MEFKDRMQKLRKEHNLTQIELSELTGISRGMIGLLEIGERNPSKKTLRKLAKAFKVSIEFLEYGKENETYLIQDLLKTLVEKEIITSKELDQETRDIIMHAVELEIDIMVKNKKANNY